MFEVRIQGDGGVKLIGRLDASGADAAADALAELDGGLALDCAELDYISSAGLAVLVATYKRLLGGGHRLRLVNVPPHIRNVLRFASLDSIFLID